MHTINVSQGNLVRDARYFKPSGEQRHGSVVLPLALNHKGYKQDEDRARENTKFVDVWVRGFHAEIAKENLIDTGLLKKGATVTLTADYDGIQDENDKGYDRKETYTCWGSVGIVRLTKDDREDMGGGSSGGGSRGGDDDDSIGSEGGNSGRGGRGGRGSRGGGRGASRDDDSGDSDDGFDEGAGASAVRGGRGGRGRRGGRASASLED